MYTYQHPRPAVTVDIAIFMPVGEEFQVLLIQRAGEPYQGGYALPGGFMEIEESLEQAARRELWEETGLDQIPLTQIHTFSQPDRDPRGRVISTCFAGLLTDPHQQPTRSGSDAARLEWFHLDRLPVLAFDHRQIIETVVEKYLPTASLGS